MNSVYKHIGKNLYLVIVTRKIGDAMFNPYVKGLEVICYTEFKVDIEGEYIEYYSF